MKPSMIFALAMLTFVVLMSSFNIHFTDVAPTVHVPENMLGDVLYVCPAVSSGWDSAAGILRTMRTPLIIGIFFALTMLLFVWGWALYQNLLKDKFNKNAFLKPWGFTKVLFWAVIIILIATKTPNHYRTVHVRGVTGDFVLCESNTPNRPEWNDIMDGRWPKATKYKNVTD